MKMGAMLILKIRPEHRSFIQQQKVFFVASAAPKGRVNVSPKGMSTLRVLGDNDVAYLDCTGSGNETRAHLLVSEDKRLTFMFCAFEGDPVILRLYGRGQSILRGIPSMRRCYRISMKYPVRARSSALPSISSRPRAAWASPSSIIEKIVRTSSATGRRKGSTTCESTGA
jgi:hypothetical protein